MEVEVGSAAEPSQQRIHIALCRMQGDNPYLTKLANTCSATSFYACKWCYCQGSTEVPKARGGGKEQLTAMRSGGYNPDLPCVLHTIRSKPGGGMQWAAIYNHCFRKSDGTLDTADGHLLVTTEAAKARAATAEVATRNARADVAARISQLENPSDRTQRGVTGAIMCNRVGLKNRQLSLSNVAAPLDGACTCVTRVCTQPTPPHRLLCSPARRAFRHGAEKGKRQTLGHWL
jgi:hypothetical protein